MTEPGTDDRALHDAHLRAALAHAPDHDASPPPGLSARIRAEARRATAPPPRPASLWRQRVLAALDWLQRPAIGTAFASLVLGTAIALIWRDGDAPDTGRSAELAELVAQSQAQMQAPPGRAVAEAPPALPRPAAPVPAAPLPASARKDMPTVTAIAGEPRRVARSAGGLASAPVPAAQPRARAEAAAPALADAQAQAAKEAAREGAQGTARDAAKEPPKEAAPEAPRETAQDNTQDTAPALYPGDEARHAAAPLARAPAPPAAAAFTRLAAEDPLAPLLATLAGNAVASAWLESVQEQTRGQWRLVDAPAQALAPLAGPGGVPLGGLSIDDGAVLWQPGGQPRSRVWRAPLPAPSVERLRRELADWRDAPASAPR